MRHDENIKTIYWAITGGDSVSAGLGPRLPGASVASVTFLLVNREAQTAREIHVNSSGAGLFPVVSAAKSIGSSFSYFRAKKALRYKDFNGMGVSIATASVVAHAWTYLSFYDGPPLYGTVMGRVKVSGWQIGTPDVSVGTGFVRLPDQGSWGMPRGVYAAPLRVEDTDTPEKRLTSVRITAREAKRFISLDDTLFSFGSSNLSSAARDALKVAALELQTRSSHRVVIRGHTDSKGDEDFNYQLGMKRAGAIKNWMIKKRIAGAPHFVTESLGESEPVAPNTRASGVDNPEGRRRNRRVEIVFR